MTRTEFIKAYAARSELSDEWAILGFIDVEGHKLIAMPCGCGDDDCEGWAMLSGEQISSHLSMYAPDELRTVYRKFLDGHPGCLIF